MAASDYGATIEGALGYTPIDVADVSETSHVTKAMVSRWMNTAAHKCDAIVTKMLGTTVDGLSPDAQEQFRELIEISAAVEAMGRFSMRGTEEYRDLVNARNAIIAEAKSGETIAQQESTQVLTTTPSERTLSAIEEWGGDGFEM
jgi:hypothetical protein